MSGIMDRYRRFVVHGHPVATGFFPVADAWACTNPSAGRGLTVGFKHAVQLRDALRAGASDPYLQAEEFHRATSSKVAPWYWSQIAVDRARLAEIDAVREGRQPAPPSDPLANLIGDLYRFVLADPDIARAFLSYVGTLTPIQETADRPEILGKLAVLKAAAKDQPSLRIPGPDRAMLLEIVSERRRTCPEQASACAHPDVIGNDQARLWVRALNRAGATTSRIGVPSPG